MVKTLLKSVLIVLVLAGVFFFAFQMWESRRTNVSPETLVSASPIGEAKATPIPTTQPVATPTVEPTMEPTATPTPKKKTPTSKKSSKKKATKPVKKKTAKKPVAPAQSEFDDFAPESPKDTSPPPPPPEKEPEPKMPDASSEPAEQPPPSDGLDLDKLFNEAQDEAKTAPSKGPQDVPPEAMDEPTAPEVAAIPPSGDGKFSTPTRDLPKVTSLSVRDEGGVTVVSIDREKVTKYKLFRMKDPSRVAVEFQNAANALQPEYPAFSGTRVKRVTTQQFTGKDETITRVIFYVEGLPKVETVPGGGNMVTLRLP